MRNFLLLLALLPTLAFSRTQWKTWEKASPYGRFYFEHSGDGNYELKVYDAGLNSVFNLQKWYFYKGSIVGEFKEAGQTRYFVYLENKRTGQQFTDKAEWETFIAENKLKPKHWTRWHSSDWHFFDEKSGILSSHVPASGIVLLFLYALFVMIFFSLADASIQLKYRRLNLIIGTLLIAIPTTRLFLDIYPYSI